MDKMTNREFINWMAFYELQYEDEQKAIAEANRK
jgi:hypothetical protein